MMDAVGCVGLTLYDARAPMASNETLADFCDSIFYIEDIY